MGQPRLRALVIDGLLAVVTADAVGAEVARHPRAAHVAGADAAP